MILTIVTFPQVGGATANPMTYSLVLSMSIMMASVPIITNMLLKVVISIAENVSNTIKFILSYRFVW
jgi:hypothetical protein